MKKNKMMRLASVLLIAVILSTCAVSGTFAKYVSSDGASDTARVAKWAYGSTTLVFENLFLNSYKDPTDTDVTVQGDGTTKVIAPGSVGSASFTFAPASGVNNEVSYTLEVDTTGSSCADLIKNNPNILWSLDGNSYGDWQSLLAAIDALDDEGEPGTAKTISETVYWKWIFDENASNKETATANNNTGDTAMGTYAGETGDLAVTLSITVTATQID